MFPEKFYFAAEPEKMREIFSFLVAKCTLNVIIVSPAFSKDTLVTFGEGI